MLVQPRESGPAPLDCATCGRPARAHSGELAAEWGLRIMSPEEVTQYKAGRVARQKQRRAFEANFGRVARLYPASTEALRKIVSPVRNLEAVVTWPSHSDLLAMSTLGDFAEAASTIAGWDWRGVDAQLVGSEACIWWLDFLVDPMSGLLRHSSHVIVVRQPLEVDVAEGSALSPVRFESELQMDSQVIEGPHADQWSSLLWDVSEEMERMTRAESPAFRLRFTVYVDGEEGVLAEETPVDGPCIWVNNGMREMYIHIDGTKLPVKRDLQALLREGASIGLRDKRKYSEDIANVDECEKRVHGILDEVLDRVTSSATES